jgi:hypothetical protein
MKAVSRQIYSMDIGCACGIGVGEKIMMKMDLWLESCCIGLASKSSRGSCESIAFEKPVKDQWMA